MIDTFAFAESLREHLPADIPYLRPGETREDETSFSYRGGTIRYQESDNLGGVQEGRRETRPMAQISFVLAYTANGDDTGDWAADLDAKQSAVETAINNALDAAFAKSTPPYGFNAGNLDIIEAAPVDKDSSGGRRWIVTFTINLESQRRS